MKIKICGITNLEDAMNSIYLGVDALGFIFYEKSPRYITPAHAEEILLNFPPFVNRVGVFVNKPLDEVIDISKSCGLDYVQLHGEESAGYCIKCPIKVLKVFKVSDISDLNDISSYQGVVNGILLDTKSDKLYGGTGKPFDWGIAIAAKEYELPLILSGGLNIDNIEKAISLVSPYGVDLNSGVETDVGIKDYVKIENIIKRIKGI